MSDKIEIISDTFVIRVIDGNNIHPIDDAEAVRKDLDKRGWRRTLPPTRFSHGLREVWERKQRSA